jgi:hypothetical protein
MKDSSNAKTFSSATLEIATFGKRFKWDLLLMDFIGTDPDCVKWTEMAQDSFRSEA